MSTHRISTTISQKHWAILNKYTEKYNTQQKALEQALDSLDNGPVHGLKLSKEEELWVRWRRDMKNGLIVLQKDTGKLFLENTDIERFKKYNSEKKSLEYAFEYYYHKPLNECSLQEIIDGIVLSIKFFGGFDSLNCTDEGGYYKINITHSMGLNVSKIIVIMHESLLKNYGAKFKIHYSEHNIFFEVHKNLKNDGG